MLAPYTIEAEAATMTDRTRRKLTREMIQTLSCETLSRGQCGALLLDLMNVDPKLAADLAIDRARLGDVDWFLTLAWGPLLTVFGIEEWQEVQFESVPE